MAAGAAHPTPAGTRSALYAARQLIQRQILARQPRADLLADLPEPAGPVIIKLAVNEQWCRACGAVVGPWMEHYLARDGAGRHIGRISACCARPDPVAATAVLQPEEYYIAN